MASNQSLDMKGSTMIIKTEHSFEPKDISDAFCGFMEGNDMSTAWCHEINLIYTEGQKPDGSDLVWYGHPEIFRGKWTVQVRYDDPEEDDEGDGTGLKAITEEDFRIGLQFMADNHGTHFYDLTSDDSGNADAITYDVLLQCIVLGEVVYG